MPSQHRKSTNQALEFGPNICALWVLLLAWREISEGAMTSRTVITVHLIEIAARRTFTIPGEFYKKLEWIEDY